MTTTPIPDAPPAEVVTPAKAPWTRPVLDVLDVVTTTQAGSNVIADTDPNQPS